MRIRNVYRNEGNGVYVFDYPTMSVAVGIANFIDAHPELAVICVTTTSVPSERGKTQVILITKAA